MLQNLHAPPKPPDSATGAMAVGGTTVDRTRGTPAGVARGRRGMLFCALMVTLGEWGS